MNLQTDQRANDSADELPDEPTFVREIGHDPVQRALSDTAADLVPDAAPADAVNESGGEAGAVKAPAISPGDDAAASQAEPALKGMAQRRIERLFNLLAALLKLADRLEDLNASNKGEPVVPRRMTNGAATNGQTHRRFMPAYDKLIADCEEQAMRAGRAAGELDENL